MVYDLLNYITIFAYVAFTTETIFQIVHLYKRKSSLDISLNGCIIRLIAVLVVLIKFVSIDDWILIIGQIFLVTSYIIYFSLVIVYRKK